MPLPLLCFCLFVAAFLDVGVPWPPEFVDIGGLTRVDVKAAKLCFVGTLHDRFGYLCNIEDVSVVFWHLDVFGEEPVATYMAVCVLLI